MGMVVTPTDLLGRGRDVTVPLGYGLMVVLKVYNFGVLTNKPKSQPPVFIDLD